MTPTQSAEPITVAIFGIKSMPAYMGVDRVVERLLDSLAHDYHFTLYVVRNDHKDDPPRKDVRYVRIPAIGGKHLKPFTFFALSALHYVFARRRYDVLHVHDTSFGMFVPVLKLKPRTKILGTFHGNDYDRQKWGTFARWYFRLSEKLFFRFCDAVTSVSRSKVEWLDARHLHGASYIPNGVDVRTSQRPTNCGFFDEVCVKPGEYLLFACGRLDSTKGLHHLLDAYIAGAFQIPLVVVGRFTDDRRYSEMIESRCAGRNDIKLFRRLLPREELLEVLHNSRLFIFPSEVEAMSMILLEAISERARVVCSSIPENVEIVGPEYPYLFDLKKKGDLLKKINLALKDGSLPGIADQLHCRCAQEFAWSSIAGSYAAWYGRIAKLDHGPSPYALHREE